MIDVKALLHNKKALYGVGGAAALGGVALYRRKKATGSTSSSTTAPADSGGTSSQQQYQQPGTYPNTYSTDLAGALGNMDSQYASAVQGYQSQLTGVQTALASLQGSGGAVTAPDTTHYNPTYTPGTWTTPATPQATAPAPTPAGTTTPQNSVTVPTTTPAQAAAPAAATLPAGYGWFDTGIETYTLDSIARRFGVSDATLIGMNPSLSGKSASSVIGKSTVLKVRSNAAPFNLAAYKKVNPNEKL